MIQLEILVYSVDYWKLTCVNVSWIIAIFVFIFFFLHCASCMNFVLENTFQTSSANLKI